MNVTVSNPDLFACDACLYTCGAVCWEFFRAPFPPFIARHKLNINQLELLTILVSLRLWKDRLRGCSVEILTDNQVSVYTFNNRRSSNNLMQCCFREIWLLLALNNINSFVRHICGKTNVLADSLSRYHLADTYHYWEQPCETYVKFMWNFYGCETSCEIPLEINSASYTKFWGSFYPVKKCVRSNIFFQTEKAMWNNMWNIPWL